MTTTQCMWWSVGGYVPRGPASEHIDRLRPSIYMLQIQDVDLVNCYILLRVFLDSISPEGPSCPLAGLAGPDEAKYPQRRDKKRNKKKQTKNNNDKTLIAPFETKLLSPSAGRITPSANARD